MRTRKRRFDDLTWPNEAKFPKYFSSMNVAQENIPSNHSETDDSARTTSSPCQSPTQFHPNDERTNFSSPPQISPPVQHMDEPINSMTTLQCSSHVLTRLPNTFHFFKALPISLKQANHQMRIYHLRKHLLLKNMMVSLICQIKHNRVLRLY